MKNFMMYLTEDRKTGFRFFIDNREQQSTSLSGLIPYSQQITVHNKGFEAEITPELILEARENMKRIKDGQFQLVINNEAYSCHSQSNCQGC